MVFERSGQRRLNSFSTLSVSSLILQFDSFGKIVTGILLIIPRITRKSRRDKTEPFSTFQCTRLFIEVDLSSVDFRLILGVKLLMVFFVVFFVLIFIVLFSLFSLSYISSELHRFLHPG